MLHDGDMAARTALTSLDFVLVGGARLSDNTVRVLLVRRASIMGDYCHTARNVEAVRRDLYSVAGAAGDMP